MNNNYKLQSINAKLKRIGKILFCTFIIYNLAFSIVFSANLALNKPVFASSAFSGSAEDAIDGDGGTRWESVHSDPQWIKVDLGDVYTVNKVTITWETAYADAYQIRVSTNNIDWTVVYSTDSESDANGLVDVITFSDTDAQYVVMYGTHRATGYGYSIYEFYVSSGYGNIALNKTATASSVQSVVAAVDGNLGLGWESKHEVDPQWIYVDLQSTYTINEVVLIWEAAYGKSYQIQGSSDANIWWENLYSTTSENGGVDTIIFSSTDTRYLRMYGTERGTGWGYNLFEFEVYYDIVSPAGISDLTALYGSDDGEVVLNWTAPGDDGTVNNLTGTFRIKYSTVAIIKSDDFDDPPSNYAVTTVDISTASLTPLTACTTTLYTLEAGASYWFAIKTQDKNDYWSVWNSSHDDTNVNTELYSAAQDLAPPAPTGVTALAGNTQIKLTWMPVTGEPDLYQYEVWCDSTDVYDFSDTFLVGTTLQAYTTFYHTGLTNGCSYLYRIITVDKGTDDGFVGTTLKSGYSDTTVSTMPYLSVPLPPTGFSGVAQSSTKIKWSWTDNASTEDGFEIRSDTDGVVIDSATLATEIPGIGGGSGGTTFWLQIGLTANTSSHVQYIHSINNYGLSEPTTDATAPVWTLANKANDCDFTDVYITTITLDWTENSNPTYTHWGVSISTDDFVTNTSTPIAYSDNLTETTTTFYSLSANCTYSFRIYSYNEDEINDWYYEAGSTSTFIEKATGVEFTVYATSISARPAGTFTDIT
ncbi:MAG: discoidin domain-containing protein, partial [Elusimicrobia bacterium]|nr:discoidin domain-containing protein [Elusimicrobiota bacterium]